jgi:hypothetical protein
LKEVGRYAVGIVWNDGHESILPHRELRAHCPCDQCAAAPRDPHDANAPQLVELQRLGESTLFFRWSSTTRACSLPTSYALCAGARTARASRTTRSRANSRVGGLACRSFSDGRPSRRAATAGRPEAFRDDRFVPHLIRRGQDAATVRSSPGEGSVLVRDPRRRRAYVTASPNRPSAGQHPRRISADLGTSDRPNPASCLLCPLSTAVDRHSRRDETRC